MGDKLLSCLPSQGGEGKPSPPLSYTEVFEEQFPYYLSIGMTPDLYWNGDPTLCKAYRKADILRQERINHEKWLQGAYIYEALCQASPLLNGMSKRTKPFPYPKKPYDLKLPTKKKTEIEKENEEAAVQKDKFMRQMQRINAKFSRIKKEEGESNGG